MDKGKIIFGILVGVVITTILSLMTASKVISTGKAEFCKSCNEMDIFYETWEQGIHGPAQKGTIKAECTDCHLPHGNLLAYLASKVGFGVNDYLAHLRGKGSPEHWLEHWKHKVPYRHQAYESGCRECHKTLVAPGIPLKAFQAHRAYELGLTRENCISCHQMVGHGDILTAMRAEAHKALSPRKNKKY